VSNDNPIITSRWGVTSESARQQAAINMLLDPVKKMEVEEAVIRQCGGNREAGLRKCREMYPEAYE
jgi:hypothetical protein